MTQSDNKKTHTLPGLVLESGRDEGKVIKIPSLGVCIEAPYTLESSPTKSDADEHECRHVHPIDVSIEGKRRILNEDRDSRIEYEEDIAELPYMHKGPPTEIWVLAAKRSDGSIPKPSKILNDTVFFDKVSAIINKNLHDDSDNIGIFKGVIYLEEILED